MVEAFRYEAICKELADRFRYAYRRKDVNLTGLIFANPEAPTAKNEVIPHIDYWHHRSDNVTDFFCAGFGAYGPPDYPRDKFRVPGIRHEEWWFSMSQFVHLVGEVEKRSTWRHGGGCEVLIVNARYDADSHTADLDFRSSIAIDLDAAKQDGAIRGFSQLLAGIFEFAKSLNEDAGDPVWDYSEREGGRVLRSSLRSALFHYLPAGLKDEAKKAVHFATRDLSPAQS